MRPRLGLLLVLPVLLVAFLSATGPARGTTATSAVTSTTGLQRSSNTDDGTSWGTSVPSFQRPTDKTNNEPLLIIAASILAVLVIGGIAALIRLRARGDDADL